MAAASRRDIVSRQRNLAAARPIQDTMQPASHSGRLTSGVLHARGHAWAWLTGSLLVSCIWLGLSAPASGSERFPGYEPDRKALDTQQKVDQLFDRGAYERAILIYRDELAPLGDKYAQYMVGYMYLTGKGVPEDPVAALAWYRLAAERGHDSFVAVYDQLSGALSTEQRGSAHDTYVELAGSLGDAAIVKRLVEKDLGLLRRSSGPAVSLSLQAGAAQRLDNRSVRQIRTRLKSRMRFLENLAATSRSDDAAFREQIAELGAEVATRIEQIESSTD